MTSPDPLPPLSPLDPVAAISRHLREGEDVVRCAAARALSAVGEERAAPDLVAALLDEDPDVRCDAMAALTVCARQEDADVIRRSLMGDPVKEVKASAIEALCRLKDRASIPLFRALARDRCDHDVAWEDGAGMWDDWLDIQIAAIAALGDLDVVDAVQDLLEVRDDEMGQDLDHIVFSTLARISGNGIETLLGLLRNGDARVRVRALSAVSKARHDLLAPMSATLILDPSPDVRRLAIACLDHDSRAMRDLALSDPDVTVRRTALAACASSRLDVAEAALADPDETVRALALEALVDGPERPGSDDVATNVRVWLEAAGAHLAATCASVLPRLCGAEAEDALCKVALDTERPQEVRISALRSLGAIDSENSIETLRVAIADPIRQVRATALANLVELAKSGPEQRHAAARDILVSAIRGDVLGAIAPTASEEAGQVPFIGASKVEDVNPHGIRITRDGEIVSADDDADNANDPGGRADNVIEGHFPRSTLQAIQTPHSAHSQVTDSPLADDEPAKTATNSPKGRRRRVAVDGPDDIGADLRLVALRIAAACPGQEIEQALGGALGEDEDTVRVAAFEAMSRRSETIALSAESIACLCDGLADPDPRIRGFASQALERCSPDAADHLLALLEDPDAIVRAIALKSVAALAPEKAMTGFHDESGLVRRAALESVLGHGNLADLESGLRICVRKGWTDSLAEASKRSPEARTLMTSILTKENTTRRQTLSALEALAAAGCSA